MEKEPDTTNVSYLDEYPHLAERVRLRRLARPALGPTLLFHLPTRAAELEELRQLMEQPPQDGA